MPAISLLSHIFLLCCSTKNDTNLSNHDSSNRNTFLPSNNFTNHHKYNLSTTLPSWIAPPSSTAKPAVEVVTFYKDVSKVELNLNFTIKDPDSTEKFREIAYGSFLIKTDGENFVHLIIQNNKALLSGQNNIRVELESYKDDVKNETTVDAMINNTKVDDMPETLPWWKTSVVYQIYPRSFKDSDNSGVGDLKGIASNLEYLVELGVGAVWMSPFYKSPMVDFGYDISDFRSVDPLFGTMIDFDNLILEMHKRGLKLIMDFVPNHSSDQHKWFVKSQKREDPYTDYYVWKKQTGVNETGEPIPPNNWLSCFGYSAWEWNEERGEFYLHQFLKEQPDLNVRNPKVMKELDEILRFWLKKGVDGFRIDALKFLFETEDLSLNEPIDSDAEVEDPNEYLYLNHLYSANQPESVDAIRRWRKIVNEFNDTFMVVEVYDKNQDQIMKYYGNSTDQLSDFPFNFLLITDLHNRSTLTGNNLKAIIDKWMTRMPEESWPNFVLGNHDRGRIASRLGNDLVDALNMLLMLLPGTPTTYYGEEIGMTDTFITYDQAQDPYGCNFGPDRYEEFGRDPSRTPMQWNKSQFSGFCNCNGSLPWLPVNENYPTLNVQEQKQNKQSHLKIYQELTKLRQKEIFTRGIFNITMDNQQLFGFQRSLAGEKLSYYILINTAEEEVPLNDLKTKLPTTGKIVMRSSTDARNQTSAGSTVTLSDISLLAGQGIVFELQ